MQGEMWTEILGGLAMRMELRIAKGGAQACEIFHKPCPCGSFLFGS